MSPRWAQLGIVGGIAITAITMIVHSLRRPPLEVYAPTPARIEPAGDTLVGPVLYTIDASSSDEWRFFDFSRGSVVAPDDGVDWDLAFRRFHIIANGGAGFSGQGGILDLGTTAFDSVRTAPTSGYVETTVGRDSMNAAIARWYDYSWSSHVLKPRPKIWAVRTADGRYARLQILSYYCPGARAGCVTFRYLYQGAGTPEFVP